MVTKKKNEENLKKINGFAGFVHHLVMFITYPFRKPLRCLLLLAVLSAAVYCVPVYYYKIKPQSIYDWYKGIFNDVKQQIVVPQDTKGTDTLVEIKHQPTSRDVRRQMFLKASGNTPQTVDILAEEASDVVDIEDIRRAGEDVAAYKLPVADKEPEAGIPSVVEEIVEDTDKPFDYNNHYGEYSNLDYLNEPIVISGEAVVHNANEMTVDGNYVFLYGIYANPRDGRGVRGKVYLKNFVQSEIVRCEIIAYTKGEAVATAECYVGEIDINRLMVERGFSDRVSAR